MKKMYHYLISSRLSVLFACLLLAQDVVAGDSATYTYKKVAAEELKLDVFFPVATGKPCPVIILFHGGNWTGGDKAQMQQQCKYFVQQGMIAITANYRLIKQDTNRKDICIMDAKSAVRWVKSNAALLHVDTNSIIIGGASAGGHLATMVVLNPEINDPADNTVVAIAARALVLFNPAYTIPGNPVMEPFRFVDDNIPPIIMFFGSNDKKWKPAGDSMHVLLKKVGVQCEMWIANNETHGFFNKEPWNSATCIKAQEFLVKHGVIKKDASLPAAAILVQQF